MSAELPTSHNSNHAQTFDSCIKKLNEEHAAMKETTKKYRKEIEQLNVENKTTNELIESLYQDLKRNEEVPKSLIPFSLLVKLKTTREDINTHDQIRYISEYVRMLIENIRNHATVIKQKTETIEVLENGLLEARRHMFDLEQKFGQKTTEQAKILREQDHRYKEEINVLEKSQKLCNIEILALKKNLCIEVRRNQSFQENKKLEESQTAAKIQSLEQALEGKKKQLQGMESKFHTFETVVSQSWKEQLEIVKRQLNEAVDKDEHNGAGVSSMNTSMRKIPNQTDVGEECVPRQNKKLSGDKEEAE